MPIPIAPDLASARALLAQRGVVHVPAVLAAEKAERWADAVLAAEDRWTSAFDDEQFSLGRAFYTHLEEDLSHDYFANAAASDALVEHVLPGFQATMRDVAARLLGAPIVQRKGFCGAGVHVFVAGTPVAERGGVVHFDTEGLTPHQIATRAEAPTIVLMLQPPKQGGGLRIWDVEYTDHDFPTEQELAAPSDVAHYEIGDAVILSAYRLHQIQPFAGDWARISGTLHLARLEDGVFESWFLGVWRWAPGSRLQAPGSRSETSARRHDGNWLEWRRTRASFERRTRA